MKVWMQKYRRLLLIGVPCTFFLTLLIIYLLGGRYVSTDDAYVKAGNAAITSYVSGQVASIYVHDNQIVRRGEPLFSLDDKPFKIAIENAQAKLASVRLEIQARKSTYQQQLANVDAAENTLRYQQQELQRQKKLAASGISSQMQLNKAIHTFNDAKEQWTAAKQQLANVLATLNNRADIAIDEHPQVAQAKAQLDKAILDLSYTTIRAPFDGTVTKVEQLQKGNYVNTGAPVFSLVSSRNIWVEANFRETQITYMYPSQKATLKIDAYPDKIISGTVASLSPGTGATFSLLPPENATGNWVKIVQRIPVRISIDHLEDAKLLTSGLSVNVTVDTKHSRIFHDVKK